MVYVLLVHSLQIMDFVKIVRLENFQQQQEPLLVIYVDVDLKPMSILLAVIFVLLENSLRMMDFVKLVQ